VDITLIMAATYEVFPCLAQSGIENNTVPVSNPSRSLTLLQCHITRLISPVRYRAEQYVITLRKGYKFFRMSHMGLTKDRVRFCLNVIVFNLKRMFREATILGGEVL
jgi:hypothetical protein